MTTVTKKIALVDDHVVIRNGLKELIEKLGPYKVQGEYNNGKELIDSFEIMQEPDLIIMDITMPGMNGDEAISILNEKNISSPVLILTLNEDENKAIQLFRMGVRGYLRKNCTAAIMKEALDEIFRCGYYHNELLSFALKTSDRPYKKTEQELILEKLTSREREFLKLICHEEEYTYDQIAGIMGVQYRTVDGYREDIFDKFGIKSKTGLVLFILRHELLRHL